MLTPAARELLDDYLRGGGNRDAPGHFLSWLTRATAVYGYLTEGGAYDIGTPARLTAGRDVGSRRQWATRGFGSSFRRCRAAWTSTAC